MSSGFGKMVDEMKLSEFDYELPKGLVAQSPVRPRDHCRLMVVNRKTEKIMHDRFFNLAKYVKPNDLLVFNDTKVFPARLFGKKESRGKVEILLLNLVTGEFLGRNMGQATRLFFDLGLVGEIQNKRIKFNVNKAELLRIINIIGYTPLPHYIVSEEGVSEAKLRRSYQTVYARQLGSAAAPTAGLHFTKKLLQKFPNTAYVTLHVGAGTFLPVKTDEIEKHQMHSEFFQIDQETKTGIQTSKRVVAVGTTTARVLESDWSKNETNIFIYPGYKFKHVDALITNFHLPKSTLLMLVSAFGGRDLIIEAYKVAIKEKYRFFSFGDAMLIL